MKCKQARDAVNTCMPSNNQVVTNQRTLVPAQLDCSLQEVCLLIDVDELSQVLEEAKPEVSPEETARLQIQLYDKLTKEDNGKFLNYKGEEEPW